MLSVRLAAVALAVATLSSCASDFGGSVSGGKDALSPEERRLQAVETRVGVLARRLDTVNLTELDQDSTRLRDDLRTLRGEVEKLRYDFDQGQKRSRDLEARLQRLEGGAGLAAAGPAVGGVPSAPPAPPPAVAPLTAPAGAAAPPRPATPASEATPPPLAPVASGLPTVTISQQGAAASPEEEAAYLAAFDLLQNGKYDDALKGFRAQIEKWPQGRFADAALRWSGEAYIIKGDRKAALTAFQTIVQRFPKSPQAPEAMYKLGLMQLELGQETEGRATLKRVIAQYPQTTPARAAQQRLEPAKR